MPDNIQEKIEDKIIDCINLGAGGRLIIFRPGEGDRSADLIVKKKGGYASRQAEAMGQSHIVKARIFGKKKENTGKEIFLFIKEKAVEKDILNVATSKNSYLVLVSFDPIKQNISDNIKITKLDDKKEFTINKKGLSKFFLDLILPA